MGRDAELVLGLAAVIGREFDLDLLSLASDITENALLDLMDVAAAAALVQELSDKPGRYVFAHALIQHTLYSDLGPTRRARAHRAVGEALEEMCGDRPASRTGELARHWSNASESVEMGKAIDYRARRPMPPSTPSPPATPCVTTRRHSISACRPRAPTRSWSSI